MSCHLLAICYVFYLLHCQWYSQRGHLPSHQKVIVEKSVTGLPVNGMHPVLPSAPTNSFLYHDNTMMLAYALQAMVQIPQSFPMPSSTGIPSPNKNIRHTILYLCSHDNAFLKLQVTRFIKCPRSSQK